MLTRTRSGRCWRALWRRGAALGHVVALQVEAQVEGARYTSVTQPRSTAWPAVGVGACGYTPRQVLRLSGPGASSTNTACRRRGGAASCHCPAAPPRCRSAGAQNRRRAALSGRWGPWPAMLAQGRGGIARAGHAQHIQHLRAHQQAQQRPTALGRRKPGEQVSHSIRANEAWWNPALATVAALGGAAGTTGGPPPAPARCGGAGTSSGPAVARRPPGKTATYP